MKSWQCTIDSMTGREDATYVLVRDPESQMCQIKAQDLTDLGPSSVFYQ